MAPPESSVQQVSHPLIEHHMARLRDVSTPPNEFRQLIQRLAVLLAYEATKDLVSETREVETPLDKINCSVITQRVGIVPILRAGLGMVDPVLNLIPSAEVWHLGVYRDEATLRPVQYYNKVGESPPVDVALVLDPMLATGGSALAALATLREWEVRTVKLLSVIAAAQGVEDVLKQFPEAQLYVCNIDPTLNEHGFIVPGLGDAGDRTFNTFPGGA